MDKAPANLLQYHNRQSDKKLFPNELLLMYRQRSGLTQLELANRLELKSTKMLQLWEQGYRLPTAPKLKKLLEIYLEVGVLIKGKEQEEARQIWESVKNFFDNTSESGKAFAPFDRRWFETLLNRGAESTVPPSSATPLPTLKITSPNNLPAALNRLVGRKTEQEQLKVLLTTEEGARLVTLTGPGGIGKTRLAIETARQLIPSFADGVFLVQLATLEEQELVIQAIAQTLKLHEQPGYLASRTPLENLQNYLTDKKTLLLLDNFEQVVGAGPDLISLLEASAGLRLLVTSRTILHLYGEQELNVPLLSYPPPNQSLTLAELETYESVKLLVERVRLVKPGFTLTKENAAQLTEICRVLEGLPLALELAAPRLKLLSPAALLARFKPDDGERLSIDLLADGPQNLAARQQTIRNTLAWSYRLLSSEEQRLFRWLGVFRGGCTLEIVLAICSVEESPSPAETMQLEAGIKQLLNHSLLQTSESGQVTRLNMLVTLREYALEKLSESSETAQAKERHALYFLQFAEGQALFINKPEQRAAFDQLAQELDNLRAAQEWALLQQKTDFALRFGVALGYFWEVRGFIQEGRQYLVRALNMQGESQPALRARALIGLARLLEFEGEYATALGYAEEALVLARQTSNKTGEARCLNIMANMATHRGEFDLAASLYHEVLALELELGNKVGISKSYYSLGNVASLQGNYEEAKINLQKSLELAIEIGNQLQQLDSLNLLGNVAMNQGLYDESSEFYRQALVLAKANDDKINLGGIVTNLGILSYFKGNYQEAEAYYLESLPLHRALGHKNFTFNVLNNLGELYREQGNYEAARRYYLESLGLGKELDNKWGIAVSFNNLGNVATQQGKFQAAFDYIQQSMTIRQALNVKPGIASCWHNLGDWAARQGQFAQAHKYYQQALDIRQEIGDRGGQAETLTGLSLALYATEEKAQAAEALRQGLALSREIGSKLTTAQGLSVLAGWLVNSPGRERLVGDLLQHTRLLLEECGAILPTIYLKIFENTQKQAVRGFNKEPNTLQLGSLEQAIEKALDL